MRRFHVLKNTNFCPTVNVESLLTLVDEETREKAIAGTKDNALVLDVTKFGAFRVLGKGLISVPVIVRAKSFTRQAEEKIIAAGGKCELLE